VISGVHLPLVIDYNKLAALKKKLRRHNCKVAYRDEWKAIPIAITQQLQSNSGCKDDN